MFSSRVPSDLTPNRIAETLASMRSRGIEWVDLTESNPTRVGLDYPPDLLASLGDPAGLRYEPWPFGLPAAREAVAGDYRRRGLRVDPGRVVVTASTSEAYSLLFRLLCDPGDEVLVPRPSYPLFEHLTRLDAVEVRPYALDYHGSWVIDTESMARGVSRRTRAVLVVSPNNPTGSYLAADERRAVADLCAEHSLALVGDEVFADYELDVSGGHAVSVLSEPHGLTFSLGGLSKSAGLPQLKLGWMAVGGPDHLVDAALSRLEIICDTYLSVATPVQQAAHKLITAGAGIREQIAARVRRNHRRLAELVSRCPSCSLLNAQGGWSAVIQVPATRSEEALVLDLLEQDHVLVYPGYFFDFPREAFVVVNLLLPPEGFDAAVERLLERVATTGEE